MEVHVEINDTKGRPLVAAEQLITHAAVLLPSRRSLTDIEKALDAAFSYPPSVPEDEGSDSEVAHGQASGQVPERNDNDARVASPAVEVGVPLLFAKKKKQPGRWCGGGRRREENFRSSMLGNQEKTEPEKRTKGWPIKWKRFLLFHFIGHPSLSGVQGHESKQLWSEAIPSNHWTGVARRVFVRRFFDFVRIASRETLLLRPIVDVHRPFLFQKST